MAASLLDAPTGDNTKPIVPNQFTAGDIKALWPDLYKKSEQKMQGMEVTRYSWWQHWARLAEYILPRRYHWLIVANKTDKGFPINGNIIDATGTVAARTLASGLMSGLTSPTRPWFRFTIGDDQMMENKAVKTWLAEVERRMYLILARSNFYDAMATMYFDLVVFGTATIIIYDDFESVIRCYNPCAGEYYLGCNATLRVTEHARKFTYTKNQCADMFGLENLPETMQTEVKAGGQQADVELVVAHLIEPNKPVEVNGKLQYICPKKFKYREMYWPFGAGGERPFAVRGFNEKPFLATRWDLVSNDPYGRSPCMDALPDIMQLQMETKRKAEAIEKQVRPPMLADVSLKNEPTSSVAGGITYVANIGKAEGMKPIFEVKIDLADMKEDLKEIQGRIQKILFVDVFMSITQLDTVRSATEVEERKQEKMIQLGPVIERTENEGLDEALDRIYAIASRKGAFPPPPAEIAGAPITIRYTSQLAELQRIVSTGSIEKLLQLAGNLAGVQTDIMDNIDCDEAVEKYADYLHVPPEIIRDPKMVVKMRQQRAQKQEQSEILGQTVAGAKGAKDLSETDVGGGMNLLQTMLSGGGR